MCLCLVASDIPGLLGLAKPLRYLGIFNCDNASHFKNIPADMISGDHGEDQILMALRAYMERFCFVIQYQSPVLNLVWWKIFQAQNNGFNFMLLVLTLITIFISNPFLMNAFNFISLALIWYNKSNQSIAKLWCIPSKIDALPRCTVSGHRSFSSSFFDYNSSNCWNCIIILHY